MPAAADHAQKRDELAALAVDLIADLGMAATTIRALAARTGYSTAVVTHYFRNKRELLVHVYESLSGAANDGFARSLASPDASMEATLAYFLPIGERARKNWRVNFAFWNLALNDESFAARQRHWMAVSQGLMRDLLVKHRWTGDLDRAARHLLVHVMGVAVYSAFDSWDDAALRRWLAEEIEVARALCA